MPTGTRPRENWKFLQTGVGVVGVTKYFKRRVTMLFSFLSGVGGATLTLTPPGQPGFLIAQFSMGVGGLGLTTRGTLFTQTPRGWSTTGGPQIAGFSTMDE
ncbi:MAG TPA: hypothetical protein VGR44_12095 [Methylomirabilota bacterium]|jgi:hypothetical protein|nr:hypothetical protein [Methylomirabilota bacterium]